MDTKFNIGDTVYLEAKVEEIHINCDGTTYRISFDNRFGYLSVLDTLLVKENQLNAET